MATTKKEPEVLEPTESPELLSNVIASDIYHILEAVGSIKSTVDYISHIQNEFQNSMNERLTLISERIGVLEKRADAQRIALQQLGNMQNEMSAAADAAIEQLSSLVSSGPLKMLGLGKLFGNIRPALNAPERDYNDQADR